MRKEKICPFYAGISKCSEFVENNGFCGKYDKCDKRFEYNKENTFVINTADGTEAANNIVGIFMNTFNYNHENFYKRISGSNKKIISNFNFLCFKWLEALNEMGNDEKYIYYDERNEASIRFAKKYISEIQRVIPDYIDIGEKRKEFISVKSYSDEEVADYMILYLSCTKNCDDFILKCRSIHRTTQQSFTRFIYKWFCYYAAQNESKKSEYIKLFKRMCDAQESFPMI